MRPPFPFDSRPSLEQSPHDDVFTRWRKTARFLINLYPYVFFYLLMIFLLVAIARIMMRASGM